MKKKSLLAKTQKLFNDKGMKTLVSVKGEMGYKSSQTLTANQGGLSKGSGVLSRLNYDLKTGVVDKSQTDADKHFCRSWTTINRYDNIQDLIRNPQLS